METKISNENFVIEGYGDTTTEGRATVVEFDRAARWGRALQGLGLAWAAAAASAFIPVAHFLTVPALALFGLILFVKRLKTQSVATGVQGICPDCRLEQTFDTGSGWSLPRTLSCGRCRRALKAKRT